MKPLKFKGTELCDGDRYGDNPELDKLVDSENIQDKLEAINKGYGLDKLIKDSSEEVRNAVLATGYRIEG